MKVTIIAGARPNFMKIAPLMRAIKAAKAAGKISLPVWSTQVRTKIKFGTFSVYRPGYAASRCISACR